MKGPKGRPPVPAKLRTKWARATPALRVRGRMKTQKGRQ